MPSLFSFQYAALCASVCVLPYKLVCSCSTVCVAVRRDASKNSEGGKGKEREFLTNGFYFLSVVEFMLQMYSMCSQSSAMRR